MSIARRLYWTDGEQNRIEHSDLDGANRQVLSTHPGALMMDLVVNGRFLYCTTWNRQYVEVMYKAFMVLMELF